MAFNEAKFSCTLKDSNHLLCTISDKSVKSQLFYGKTRTFELYDDDIRIKNQLPLPIEIENKVKSSGFIFDILGLIAFATIVIIVFVIHHKKKI